MDLDQIETLLRAIPTKRERLAVLGTLLERHPNLVQLVGVDQLQAIEAAAKPKRTRRAGHDRASVVAYHGDGRNMATGTQGTGAVASPWLASRFGRIVAVNRTLSEGDYYQPDEYGRYGGDMASELPEWLAGAWGVKAKK